MLKDNKQTINLSSKSLKEKNIEEEKKSSTNNVGDEMTVPLVINNINDNNNAQNKGANNNNEDNNRLNLGVNGQNRLGTVLETINEVSNSKVDSSDLSDDDEEDNNNNNANIDNNKKSMDNNDNTNNKKEVISECKKNDSDKNTFHLV